MIRIHNHIINVRKIIKARRYLDRYVKFITSRIELNKTRGDVEGHIHHQANQTKG